MAEEHPPDWPKIVERHAERVFRIAYRILGSEHDAEDVSQLVFIDAKRVQEAVWALCTFGYDPSHRSAALTT